MGSKYEDINIVVFFFNFLFKGVRIINYRLQIYLRYLEQNGISFKVKFFLELL